MDRDTKDYIMAEFLNLPNNVIARRAFCAALKACGHKFVYMDEENGDMVTVFRILED